MDIPGGWETRNPKCGQTSLILAHRKTGQIMLYPGTCHTWRCEYCAHARARCYVRAIIEANPDSAWELTVRQGRVRDSLEDCHRYLQAIPRVVRSIRRDWGAFEYFWTYELFARGGAHVHGLSRGVCPDNPYLSEQCELAGIGFVTAIRPIKRQASDILHATKYLFKAHSKGYMTNLPARRVHVSRKFLPCAIRDFGRAENPDYNMVDIRFDLPSVTFERMQANPKFTSAFLPEETDHGFTLAEFVRGPDGWNRKPTAYTSTETHADEHNYNPPPPEETNNAEDDSWLDDPDSSNQPSEPARQIEFVY